LILPVLLPCDLPHRCCQLSDDGDDDDEKEGSDGGAGSGGW